ncbi:hypothetical protein CERSUDRAFT_83858 [Gelatoporia subvermispora B]|uniref:Hyaluronan/mRNA-binding protein domain-containing protein n=1 Tax=Ceriporiopsis subvermispora (strain B) TaxID=914234 RepID=M2PKL1_CERS8|nr:hypothetical protein CERSUDRAFT_83858 [Gelatoporia subvermispora B]
MTRTERAAYPRAIIKDHSEPRNGMDRHIPKGGAGQHNWGSLERERELEEGAQLDEELEYEEAGAQPPHREQTDEAATIGRTKSNSVSEEDIRTAREFRKKALKKDGVDLGDIARTSAAVSVSPPNRDVPIASDANTDAIHLN